MTVFENVAFGLRMQKTPAAEITPRVMEALRMVQLETFAQRKPHQLSGGQQQRVAMLARWLTSLVCCCWMSRSQRWITNCVSKCRTS